MMNPTILKPNATRRVPITLSFMQFTVLKSVAEAGKEGLVNQAELAAVIFHVLRDYGFIHQDGLRWKLTDAGMDHLFPKSFRNTMYSGGPVAIKPRLVS